MDVLEPLEPQRVVKGGICWFDLAIDRGPKGLEVYVKTDPRVEDFVKSLGNGKNESVEIYGRSWYSLTGKDLEIHQIERSLESRSYTLEAPAETFRSARDGRVNLSFLRIAGIGEPQGVRFGVAGPFSKSHVRELMSDVITETRSLIRDYIVPVHINLRISSQEI